MVAAILLVVALVCILTAWWLLCDGHRDYYTDGPIFGWEDVVVSIIVIILAAWVVWAWAAPATVPSIPAPTPTATITA